MPTVQRIWTAPEGSAPMEARDSARAIADVVEGGEVVVGDELRVVAQLDDPDSLADAIRERRSG